MRHIWLVVKREYLEHVRKRSFLISTLLFPALMFCVIVLPAKLATLRSAGEWHIAVVVSRPEFGEVLEQEIIAASQEHPAPAASATKEPALPMSKYRVDIDLNSSEAERAVLRTKVARGEIDGYLWATDDAIAAGRLSYSARETSDFMQIRGLLRAVNRARVKSRLQIRGFARDEIARLFSDFEVETVNIKAGAETKIKGGALAFMGPLVIVMLMYMTVLIYSVWVMRAVLEEKNSRVVEVLLSSITAKEMMAGKILGVGAVGLTQIGIWVALAVPVAAPALARGTLGDMQVSTATILWFPVFYVLGFLLYSTFYAALGALVNSEQEAQQWQMVVMAPLIIAAVVLMSVVRQPNSSFAVWSSLVPFVAPVLMFARIAVQTPPAWQIALSILLLLGTIYAAVGLCGRIYHLGILMYGKRPTLPEILRWSKYA